jgi:hypothetical protein
MLLPWPWKLPMETYLLLHWLQCMRLMVLKIKMTR